MENKIKKASYDRKGCGRFYAPLVHAPKVSETLLCLCLWCALFCMTVFWAGEGGGGGGGGGGERERDRTHLNGGGLEGHSGAYLSRG